MIGGSVSVMLMIGGEILGASGTGEAETGLSVVGHVVSGPSMIGPSTQSSVSNKSSGKLVTES